MTATINNLKSLRQQLNQLAKKPLDLNHLFAQDPSRFSKFSYTDIPQFLLDLSKQHITVEILEALISLARTCQFEHKRDAMFAGEKINWTENRQVLHTALRSYSMCQHDEEVSITRQQMLEFAQSIHDTPEITDIVNIGIGGSDVGPRMAAQALSPYIQNKKNFHFVANADGFELASVLEKLQPQNTLFIIVSKTFTTQETLINAQSARYWFEQNGGTDAAKHFIGVTANIQAALDFGIEKTFSFWEWVGGRYSIWSAVGLSLAIAIGAKNFLSFLDGAHEMDQHFSHMPLEKNIPVLLALIDIWNRNFLNRNSRCIAPYHQGLALFPRYLQQLEMESNGKSVDQQGHPLSYSSAPIIWGEVGTNCQHTFFQMLHQGTDIIPVDFILVKEPLYPHQQLKTQVLQQLEKQHRVLLMNGLAQSRALMVGQHNTPDPKAKENQSNGLPAHNIFPGNRPSTTLILDKLTPHALGALIALHEHRVFSCGIIWNINSFDQWGVELGKRIAKKLLNEHYAPDLTDASTRGLYQYLKAGN